MDQPMKTRARPDAWQQQQQQQTVPGLGKGDPPQSDGKTLFPFRRLFIVAQV